MRSRTPAALLALALLSAPAAADTLKVPAQFATIAAAEAAAADGDTIVVAKGTYAENVIVDVPNLTLVGKGAVIDGEYADPCLEVVADGVTVRGFTLVNGTDGIFASGAGITIENCRVYSCSGSGINVEGAPATIRRNSVEGCVGTGITYLHSLPGAGLVERNVCSNNGGDGLAITGDDLVVSRNTCEGNEGDGIDVLVSPLSLQGLGLPVDQAVLVERNTCRGNEDDGLEATNETGSQVTLERNDCSGNCDFGIDADGTGFTISRNTCDDNRDEGLSLGVSASLVEDNRASGNEGSGIAVFAILPLGDGGVPEVGSLNTLQGNLCAGNAGDGIRLEGAAGNELLGNTCRDNLDDGIDLDDPDCTDTLVSGNTCTGNGHEGLDNGGSATTVTGNTCRKNGRGLGPDIAGTGDGGAGSAPTFTDNQFDTGGADVPSRLDRGAATAP